MKFIPYGHQIITDGDISAVIKALTSEWLTQGPTVSEFESALSHYCGAEHAVAVSNATAALHLACLALDVKPGDIVWTVPNTFVASANCALYCGASIDFVDIDSVTYNMSVSALKTKLAAAKELGKLPKVVIPVHFAGQSCDMEAIKALSEQYGFFIVEDASHAIGGSYKNKKIGCCEYSDITVFSFHPVKIMTTCEGGVVLTNQAALAEKINLLRTHGIVRKPDEQWRYQQVDLGYNYRISDVQCALGLSQLSRVDEYVARRHDIAKQYNQALSVLPVTLPHQASNIYSAFHLYVIKLKLDQIKKSRSEIFDAMRAANIGVNVHYIPVHIQPYYKNLGFEKGQFPEAEQYYEEALTLPLWPGMTTEMIEYVASALRNSLEYPICLA